MKNHSVGRTPQGMFLLMRRHPYLLTILLCALLLPFGFADRAKLTTASYIYLGITLSVLFAAAVFFFRLGLNLKENLLLCGIFTAGVTAAMLTVGCVADRTTAIAVIALIAAVGAAVFIRRFSTLDFRKIITLMLLLGIAIRFV